MINISNKEWKELTVADIENAIRTEEESFYFEFKDDRVDTRKIAEEISAMANTYGGYIFLGVSDKKEICGCTSWTEQKIHTMIHDALSPTPDFDVKKFVTDDKKIILVIKIEEGTEPPYITSRGKICERISSGSFEIKNSAKLNQMYYKKEKEIKQIEKKLTIPPIQSIPNLFGYFDMGISLKTLSGSTIVEQFMNADLKQIAFDLKQTNSSYTISQVGNSIVISVGEVKNDENIVEANLHNFMEIMIDGSVKMRILLTNNRNEPWVNIACIMSILSIFSGIYSKVFGMNFEENLVGAYKYEELTVQKQFNPYIQFNGGNSNTINKEWEDFHLQHIQDYGNNLIITGNRIPKSGLNFWDKRYINGIKENSICSNIIEALFHSHFSLVGYILADE